ncbi:PH domain-containing protein [Deinococcus kurensis]|uniref:PH domain-containing protein n=1 Tax=Deinococcus kurensis TaxID=2662757 RepID=UPI001F20DCA9|nr:PH domain-containing protein [Deinococcus kurensis]
MTTWMPDDSAEKPLPVAGSVALTLLGVGLAALFVQLPRRLSYTLTDTGLRVSRFSGTFEWPYRELRVRRTDGGLGLKMGGVGLPGYYTGTYTFTGAAYLNVQAIASTTRDGLIVERGDTPYYPRRPGRLRAGARRAGRGRAGLNRRWADLRAGLVNGGRICRGSEGATLGS